MRQLLVAEFPKFATSYEESSTNGLRTNTLKLGPADLLALLSGGYQPVPWCSSGFALPGDTPLGRHPHHAAGLFYLQDPSAMAAAEILAPQPGERVLDLSAAPGGKTTHLASLMGDQGLLVANEIHPQRVWELAENLERWGVRNILITNETPARLAAHFGAYFDRVLVDAPCSGEGMFRKSAAARRDWSPALVQSCAVRQSAILGEALKLVRPGGYLLYSTCTFNPTENEAVIARLLDTHPELELLIVPRYPGFSPGRPDWLPPDNRRPELEHAVRVWPQHAPGEGHFMALLRKKMIGSGQGLTRHTPNKISKGERDLFERFRAECLPGLELDPGRLSVAGSYLYLQPELAPDLQGLRLIHPGWWLGVFKKGRFEPSHALALALQPGQAARPVDYPAEAPTLTAYLRGETLASPGQNGWVLITVHGFPLGWGKRSQGVVKNDYPRGLRIV
jgi:NOL1/NOP2/sun family putative RNA methylase